MKTKIASGTCPYCDREYEGTLEEHLKKNPYCAQEHDIAKVTGTVRKRAAENPEDPVENQIRTISDGTLSTLADVSDYAALDTVRADWLRWYMADHQGEFDNWQDAWAAYSGKSAGVKTAGYYATINGEDIDGPFDTAGEALTVARAYAKTTDRPASAAGTRNEKDKKAAEDLILSIEQELGRMEINEVQLMANDMTLPEDVRELYWDELRKRQATKTSAEMTAYPEDLVSGDQVKLPDGGTVTVRAPIVTEDGSGNMAFELVDESGKTHFLDINQPVLVVNARRSKTAGRYLVISSETDSVVVEDDDLGEAVRRAVELGYTEGYVTDQDGGSQDLSELVGRFTASRGVAEIRVFDVPEGNVWGKRASGGTFNEGDFAPKLLNDIPPLNPIGVFAPPAVVNEWARCASCLRVFPNTATNPAAPIPPCPHCGSLATTTSGSPAPGVAYKTAQRSSTVLRRPAAYRVHAEADWQTYTTEADTLDEAVQKLKAEKGDEVGLIGQQAKVGDGKVEIKYLKTSHLAAARYELVDSENPDERGQMFSTLERAQKVLDESVPKGRFFIKDKETGEKVAGLTIEQREHLDVYEAKVRADNPHITKRAAHEIARAVIEKFWGVTKQGVIREGEIVGSFRKRAQEDAPKDLPLVNQRDNYSLYGPDPHGYYQLWANVGTGYGYVAGLVSAPAFFEDAIRQAELEVEELRADAREEFGASRKQASKIDGFRKILETHQYADVDGVPIDVQSANAVVTVYDNLSPENQQKFESFAAERMVEMAWKLLAKPGAMQ